MPAFSGEEAEKIIIAAIGAELFAEQFKDFELTPLASASIAQVHTATMLQPNGEQEVVLKVLRPNIEKTILADIDVMSVFAKIVARWLPDGKRLRPVEVVGEYKKTIIEELDLNREASNAIQLKHN